MTQNHPSGIPVFSSEKDGLLWVWNLKQHLCSLPKEMPVTQKKQWVRQQWGALTVPPVQIISVLSQLGEDQCRSNVNTHVFDHLIRPLIGLDMADEVVQSLKQLITDNSDQMHASVQRHEFSLSLALQSAIIKGSKNTFEALWNETLRVHGPDAAKSSPTGPDKWSTQGVCVLHRRFDFLVWLKDHNGFDASLSNGMGDNLIHAWLGRRLSPADPLIDWPDQEKMLAFLVENGVDINHQNTKDRTPLLEAALEDNCTTAIQLLLEYGANPDQKLGKMLARSAETVRDFMDCFSEEANLALSSWESRKGLIFAVSPGSAAKDVPSSQIRSTKKI